MDTSDPEIIFDESGNCNHCNEYFERTSQYVYKGEESEKELEAIVAKIKKSGKGRKYDCVLGVSGGIDSSYAAYIAKKYGLRVLCVHLDNGWNSEISVKNIKNMASILGFDYESYVLDWEQFKDLQLSFFRASVPEIETPTDIAIPGSLHEVAARYGIKFVLSGGNYATEGILPKIWHYNGKDVTYLKAIHRRFGKVSLKGFPTFGYWREMYFKFIKGIKIIYILNYVPYAKKDAMQLLGRDLGWRYYGGKHYESKITGFLHSYYLPVKHDIDYRKATLSTQICAGEVTREEALEELKKPPYDTEKSAQERLYIIKKLGISEKEFEMIEKAEPKWYWAYPNDKKKLEFIYKVYRWLFPKK
jgi:N-acetyl sugar amidotransferase